MLKSDPTLPLDKPTAKVILGALEYCALSCTPPAVGLLEGEQAQLDQATQQLLARLQNEFPQLATSRNYPGLIRGR